MTNDPISRFHSLSRFQGNDFLPQRVAAFTFLLVISSKNYSKFKQKLKTVSRVKLLRTLGKTGLLSQDLLLQRQPKV